jgi:hypothetical protein
MQKEDWEQRYEEEEEENAKLVDAVRPKLTAEFMAVLDEAAEAHAFHASDFYEVIQFIQWVHEIAGIPCPEELDPFA